MSRPHIDPLEQACREFCRDNDIPETEWRIFERTLSAARRACSIALERLVEVVARAIAGMFAR
jgi:hypothetical protein